MFLCQPLIELLASRGIGDVDAFLKAPSWSDLPDPLSIPSMEDAAARVLLAVREKERITIYGDYDCDGVLGTHILQSVLKVLGAAPRTYLPHRDEGYGLSSVDNPSLLPQRNRSVDYGRQWHQRASGCNIGTPPRNRGRRGRSSPHPGKAGGHNGMVRCVLRSWARSHVRVGACAESSLERYEG